MMNELPDRKAERSAFLEHHMREMVSSTCIQYLKDMRPIDAHQGMAAMLNFLESVTAYTIGLVCEDKEIYRKFILQFYKKNFHYLFLIL